MLAKFNLELSDKALASVDYASDGNVQKVASKQTVKKALDKYLREDGTLDASTIEADWFPMIDAEVFISHSHKNERLAINLAGYLAKECGVSSFIDSTVWGYADELLKALNDKYSKSTIPGQTGYDYNLVNRSASQVYLLLQGALAKMINHCECLIFLNTPSSLQVSDVKDESLTASPWIYSELTMASTFPQRGYDEYRLSHSYMAAEMRYKVCLDSFVELSFADIEKARKEALMPGLVFLDKLYENKGIIARGRHG